MTETQSFFIDTIELAPEGSICFIQAPSNDDCEFLQLMEPSRFPYYQQIALNGHNKLHLSELVKRKRIEESFQSLEIRNEEDLLFEAFDGMEIGTFSKSFQLPRDYLDKYKSLEMLSVSNDW